MTKNRKFQILMSLVLVAGILLAALPTAPVLALSAPAGTTSMTNINAVSQASVTSCVPRVYIKDHRVTYEHRGNLTIVHVSETVVTVRADCKSTERHRAYTYIKR